MPPEIKRNIYTVKDMICKNCIFSSETQEELIGCHNNRSGADCLSENDYCADGKWMYYGKYFEDDNEQNLYVFDYSDLYEMFLRQVRKCG